MKYKKGHTVTIRKDLKTGKWYGDNVFFDGMKKYRGKKAKITRVRDDNYGLDIDSEFYGWTDEMLEHRGRPKKVKAKTAMKPKSILDAKSGDILVDKDGDYYEVSKSMGLMLGFSADTPKKAREKILANFWSKEQLEKHGFKFYKPEEKIKLNGEYTKKELQEILEGI